MIAQLVPFIETPDFDPFEISEKLGATKQKINVERLCLIMLMEKRRHFFRTVGLSGEFVVEASQPISSARHTKSLKR